MLGLLLGVALAASLDQIEVGGPWGTPATTEPTALWWNPAGLAAGKGTRLYLEGAPTWGGITFDRASPRGGPDEVRALGLIPFAGVASDLTVPGLGLGLGLAAPTARQGRSPVPQGSGSYHLRQGTIQKLHAMFGGGYAWKQKIAVGAGVHAVFSQWGAQLDYDGLPDLVDEMQALGIDEIEGIELDYTDDDLESEDYRVALDFQELQDTTFTWNVGTRVQPLPQLAVAVAYVAPFRVENTGATTLTFNCPGQDDVVGRYGLEAFGLCAPNGGPRTLSADGTVAYDLPWRLHFGVELRPVETLRLEVMGGLVGWSRFQDFQIGISGIAEQNTFDTPLQKQRTPALTEQDRDWARSNRDAFFAGVDAKVNLGERGLVGGRLLFDRAAVPTEWLSPNNYDADAVMLTAHGAWLPVSWLRAGLGYTQTFYAVRDNPESAFGMTLDTQARNEDRAFYPHMAGEYRGSIQRVSVNLGFAFGAD